MDDLDYLRPDFDPSSRSVRVADLQRIFIDHGVRYAQAKTKADLAKLYDQHIRPQAAKLLAQRERVRASSTGIEDRRLTDGQAQPANVISAKPRKPLIPPQYQKTLPSSASSSRLSATAAAGLGATSEQSKAIPSRKSASMNNLAGVASSRVTAKQSARRDGVVRRTSAEQAVSRRSSRRSASVEIIQGDQGGEQEDDIDGDADMIIDSDVPRSTKRQSIGTNTTRRHLQQFASNRARPQSIIDETDDEVDELMELDDPEMAPDTVSQNLPRTEASSPARRTVIVEVPVRRQSDIASPHKRKKHESDGSDEGKSGFSNSNPFQSSPEAEGAKKRRRKSSLGVQREITSDMAGMKRSKTLADFTSSSNGTLAEVSDHKRASLDAPKPSAGLERFKERLSGSSDNLPPPLRERKWEKGRPSSLPRVSSPLPAHLSSLAQAPEDFEVKSFSSPRKQSLPPPRDQKLEAQRLYRDLEQQVQDEPDVYQSGAVSASDDEPSLQVAASSGSPSNSSAALSRLPNPPKIDSAASAEENQLIPKAPTTKEIARRTAQGRSLESGLVLLGLVLLAALWQSASLWLDGKKNLGFCNTGAGVNDAVIQRQSQSVIVRQKEFDPYSWQDYADRAQDMLAPVTCTPCPDQARCRDGQVINCNRGYVLSYHILDVVAPKSTRNTSILSILLPPHCRSDTAHYHRLFQTASRIGAELRRSKGMVICTDQVIRRTREAARMEFTGPSEAWIYGKEQNALKTIVRRQLEVLPWGNFDRVFEEAVEYLSNHTEILQAEHGGETWLAATATDMPLGCRIRLSAYSVADENKGSLGLLGLVLASVAYGRSKIRRRRQISEEVDELVPLSLSLLQAQCQNYMMQDSMTPYPYLAPAQLRDLVLRDERSSSRKAELWSRVETRVESNANVRARVAEQHGEDVRVWQWIGAAYEVEATPGDIEDTNIAKNRRRSYAARTPRSSLAKAGIPHSHASERHVSWNEDEGLPADNQTSL